jgi:ribosome-binding factor A
MSSRRIAKVAEALRECVSTTVLFELKDPRVKNVTVLRTEVSPDLKSARVYVSVLGDDKAQALSMHGLRSARGFIQSKIADRLELRYTPVLTFVLDPAVKLSTQASAILREVLQSTAGDAEPAGDDAEGGETEESEGSSHGDSTEGDSPDGGADGTATGDDARAAAEILGDDDGRTL